MLTHIWRYKLNRDQLGLRLGNWKRSILEGLWVSAAMFPLLMLVKWLLVLHDPEFYGKPVLAWGSWDRLLPVYLIIAPAQELLTRGFLQSSIERFLRWRYRSIMAVGLSSAQFGVMHLHYSFRMALIATAGSIIFGTMFARHRTLVGVSIAHFILGALIIGPLQLMFG